MYKFGFEREYFTKKDGDIILPPSRLPVDEGGLLVESRGKPQRTILEAVFSLMAQEHLLIQRATKIGVALVPMDVHTFDREQVIEARRHHQKGLIRERNLYGHQSHAAPREATTAGIHLSITRTKTKYVDSEPVEYHAPFDYAHAFRLLDEHFAEEIEAAQRLPGFYELKDDGRIEYRSLPTSLNIVEAADSITSTLKKARIS